MSSKYYFQNATTTLLFIKEFFAKWGTDTTHIREPISRKNSDGQLRSFFTSYWEIVYVIFVWKNCSCQFTSQFKFLIYNKKSKEVTDYQVGFFKAICLKMVKGQSLKKNFWWTIQESGLSHFKVQNTPNIKSILAFTKTLGHFRIFFVGTPSHLRLKFKAMPQNKTVKADSWTLLDYLFFVCVHMGKSWWRRSKGGNFPVLLASFARSLWLLFGLRRCCLLLLRAMFCPKQMFVVRLFSVLPKNIFVLIHPSKKRCIYQVWKLEKNPFLMTFRLLN